MISLRQTAGPGYGSKFVYTGEGGNELLGSRKQVSNQTLTKVCCPPNNQHDAPKK